MHTRSLILLVLAQTLTHFTPAWAQCTTLKSVQSTLGESIGIAQDPEIPRRWVERAIALWSSCPNYGRDFPTLLEGRTGTRQIEVRYQRRSGTGRCGSFQGSTITLYKSATSSSGQALPCRVQAQTLAHELGHVLGLQNASEDRTCGSRIMARNNPDKLWRKVSAEECRLVGRKWHTPAERGVPILALAQGQSRNARTW